MSVEIHYSIQNDCLLYTDESILVELDDGHLIIKPLQNVEQLTDISSDTYFAMIDAANKIGTLFDGFMLYINNQTVKMEILPCDSPEGNIPSMSEAEKIRRWFYIFEASSYAIPDSTVEKIRERVFPILYNSQPLSPKKSPINYRSTDHDICLSIVQTLLQEVQEESSPETLERVKRLKETQAKEGFEGEYTAPTDNEVKTDKSCKFCEKDVRKKQCLAPGLVEVWMNYGPFTDGHFMLVTKRHVTHSRSLTKDEILAQYSLMQIAAKALGKQVKFVLQDGALGGQTVPHSHLHVIKRADRSTVAELLTRNEMEFKGQDLPFLSEEEMQTPKNKEIWKEAQSL